MRGVRSRRRKVQGAVATSSWPAPACPRGRAGRSRESGRGAPAQYDCTHTHTHTAQRDKHTCSQTRPKRTARQGQRIEEGREHDRREEEAVSQKAQRFGAQPAERADQSSSTCTRGPIRVHRGSEKWLRVPSSHGIGAALCRLWKWWRPLVSYKDHDQYLYFNVNSSHTAVPEGLLAGTKDRNGCWPNTFCFVLLR